MISIDGFSTALAWLRAGITERREFAPLASDLDQINAIGRGGYRAFMDDFATWTPAKLERYSVPKGDGREREVFYIPVFDRVATLALLTTDYGPLHLSLMTFQREVDHATPLPVDPADSGWFTRFKDEYASFRKRTSTFQQNGYEMLFADIADFAPNCRIAALREALKNLNMNEARADKLCDTLETWQKNSGLRGIPQGYAMTDLLLKVYMHPFDRIMRGVNGTIYYRYNDDIRIAARWGRDLQRAHNVLEATCEKFGLRLNPAKTSWHTPQHPNTDAKDALQIENYLQPAWTGLRMTDPELRNMPADVRGFLPYDALPPALLRSVYATHIAPQPDDATRYTPVTLFNFVIRRMGKAGLSLPANDITALARNHTERLGLLLEYVKQMHDGGHDVAPVSKALSQLVFDPASAYGGHPYSKYLFVRFLGDMAHIPAQASLLRDLAPAVPASAPQFLRRALADSCRMVPS